MPVSKLRKKHKDKVRARTRKRTEQRARFIKSYAGLLQRIEEAKSNATNNTTDGGDIAPLTVSEPITTKNT